MDTHNKLKILQCNLDRCKNAQHEILLSFMAGDYDIALISEPYIGSGEQVKSTFGIDTYQFFTGNKIKTCILAKPGCGSILGLSQYSTSNFCAIKITFGNRNIYIASIYVEPNIDESNTLDKLDVFLKNTGDSHKIVRGDLNGWHPIWGSVKSNPSGNEVIDIIHSNDVYVCNVGNIPTFETVTHGRDRSSIIDLTFASGSIIDNILEWRVNLNISPISQHNAIDYCIDFDTSNTTHTYQNSTFLYKANKACWPIFKDKLHTHMTLTNILEHDISTLNVDDLEHIINELTNVIHSACRASMHVKSRGTKPKAPWWTEELETLKREVVDLHHQLHAAKRQGMPLEHILETRKQKKELYANKMREESTRHFREFCELQTKENVWSLTNRLLKNATPRRPPVTLNRGSTYTTDSQETAKALLNHFYPDDSPDTLTRHHELRSEMTDLPQSHDDPPFTQEEVLECLKQMSPKKAPGLDNFTSDICLQFATDYPRLLTDILNRCLTLQHFPDQWKTAYVKIIPKPGKSDYSALESFRPIGLLPVFGKLLEKLFIKRVVYHAQRNNRLNKFQFGFREQTNTCEAIHTALKIIKLAKSEKHLSIAISLDIKAAFDNAWWPALFHMLRHIQCPNNIFGLIQDYVRDRRVILDHAGRRVTKTLSKGCIQGSTCGPILWNIILDELLDARLPAGCHFCR
ncbi:unnamed protein product [Parnassius apollo]|uniref:(apollo) hypothetical protein n=1 Tax=Parnassius apollo TaxID=110799 RepID=A0A8S3XFH2_PARAO|nr:unnamed protein product [Parnassius apollo]